MRTPLFVLCWLTLSDTCAQSLTHKYLHFRSDYFWDTILYKSAFDYYYEVEQGKIRENQYPVLFYHHSELDPDSPGRKTDIFFRQPLSSSPPWQYIQKGSRIYLRCIDPNSQKLRLHLQYQLNSRDTVRGLAEIRSLDDPAGTTISGSSTYQGVETIWINGKSFKTFCFLEIFPGPGDHQSSYTRTVYLDQTRLIPLKLVRSGFNRKGGSDLYRTVTTLVASGDTVPDYSTQKTRDLVVYENKTLTWTERQKEEFLRFFTAEQAGYAACLLEKLNGHISFFHFERSEYFMALLNGKECK